MSVVLSVRIPRKLKEELDSLGIDYREAVRSYLEELARREKARRLRERIRRLQERIGRIEGNNAARLVREDREAH